MKSGVNDASMAVRVIEKGVYSSYTQNSALLEQPEKVNESLDTGKLEFIRNMRIAMRKLEFPESAIEDVKWLVSQFESDVTDHHPGKPMYFSQQTYNEIVDNFSIVNQEIAARFFDGEPLFDEDGIKRSFIGDQAITDSATFDLFAKVLKNVALKSGKKDKLVNPIKKARLKLGDQNMWVWMKNNRHWAERIIRSIRKRG